MPTFILFLLVYLLIAAIFRLDFFFTVAYFFFAIYLISRIWTQRSVRQMHIQRRFTDHAFCGDEITISTILKNPSWLPAPWMQIHESLPVQLAAPPFHHEIISIAPYEKHRLEYTLQCRQRGYYAIGPLSLESGDLLGLTRRITRYEASQTMIVYPRVIPLQHLGLPTRSPQVALPARTPLFEDPARIMGVREYQRGDNPRRIHWTASASAGDLLVKQYQPSIARETVIFLDLNQDTYEQRNRYVATELAITAAASIASHIVINESLPAGLVTEAWDPIPNDMARFHLPARSERNHLINILEVLARVQIATATPFADIMRQESIHLPWGTTLTLITGGQSEDLLDMLAYLKQKGFAVSLVLIQPPASTEVIAARAGQINIPIHRIWQEHDLEGRL